MTCIAVLLTVPTFCHFVSPVSLLLLTFALSAGDALESQTGAPPSSSELSIRMAMSGAKQAGAGTLWRMTPDSSDATVQVDKKPEGQVEEQRPGALPDTIAVRCFSLNV
jgi:hypothetical protein